MADAFSVAGIPIGPGTGERPSARPLPRLAERPPLDRARALVVALNEDGGEKYFQRQEFYEDNVDRLSKASALTATSPPIAESVPDDEVSACCELVADERLPDGPPVGWLLLRWEAPIFATLLLADSSPS